MKQKKRKLRPLLFLALTLCCLFAVRISAAQMGSGVACLSYAEPMIKSGLAGEPLAFSPADFRQAVGLARIGALP